MPQIGKFIETENRMMVTGAGMVKNKKLLLKRYRFSV
jgi:hypothetical protein